VGVDEMTQFDQVIPVTLDCVGRDLSGAHSTTTTVSPALTESPAAT
jgi:hypothetical protein